VKKKPKAILKIACVAGVLLLLLFLGLTLGTSFLANRGILPASKTEAQADFYQNLYLFDKVLAMETSSGSLNHTHIGNLLKTLEKSAVGTEAWLSLLKRYRKLSKQYPEYVEGYHSAVSLAEKKYPHSAMIVALSAEAALSAKAALLADPSDVPTEKLKQTALLLSESGPLSQGSLFPIAFCLYASGGSFDTVESALSVKRVDALFDAFNGSLPYSGGGVSAERVREAMLVDAALVKIVDGKLKEAAYGLARLEPDKVVLPKTLPFIANYSFDFANPLLAAELWVKSGSEKDIARAASALYTAGETEGARTLWLALTKDAAGGAPAETDRASRGRALYNAAATAASDQERIPYLEQLLAGTGSGDSDTVNAGLVMYTRLQTEERARAILSDYPFTGQAALLDLEYLRRSMETMPPDRAIAETWLLLNRHPDAEEIYRWAAWHFEYQRRYEDLEALSRFAARNHMESHFLDFHRALRLVMEGSMKEGLDLLEASADIPAWQRHANIALALYARREFAAALTRWEAAAAAIPSGASPSLRAAGARIYLKMAECRRILGGRPEEVRRDLERAQELDGENIDVRLALRRTVHNN
jgi:tetratricopeptide (TPR) repeat protein